jgi:hypothetical protein
MRYFPKQRIAITDGLTHPSSRAENDNVIDEIKSFFIDISKEQVETLFSSILEVCLTAEDPAFETSEARFELLLTLKKIECLIETVSLL